MRIWIAAAVLVALAAIGLVVVPYAVEWERYRSDIEVAAEKLSGHKITIEGPIDVVLLPRPALIARDVKMTSRPEGAIGFELTSQQVDMGFRAGPLLVGRPIVGKLKMTRPRIVLDQATSNELRSWPPRLDQWSSTFFQPDLRLITIVDGRLDLAGFDDRLETAVNDLSLTLAAPTAEGPFEAAGLFKTTHHRFAITGAIGKRSNDGSSTVKVKVDVKNGVEETTTLNLSGVLQRQGPEAGLHGRFDLAGPDLQHSLKAVSAVTGYPSTFLSLAPEQPFQVQSRLHATKDALTTDDARITLSEKFGRGKLELLFNPKPTLNLAVDLPPLRLADDTTLIDFVPLDLLSVFPATPGKIDIRLRELVYRDGAVQRGAITIVTDEAGIPRIERARAQLPGLVEAQFNGSVRPSQTGRTLNGKLTATGDDLGETIRWLGLPLADQSKGWRGFSIESDLDINNVQIALSAIDMRLDTLKLSGQADMRFSERMNLTLDVDIERLNLDLYTTERHATESAALLGQQLDWLDTSIDARFQHLSWRGLRLEEATLSATAHQQHFKLGAFTFRTVGDTAMTVEGEIDLQTEDIDLTTELTSQFPTRVLRHLDIGLPLASTRLKPLALGGWVKGKLGGFDVGLRTDYDAGRWVVEGRAGWIEKQAHYDLQVTAEHPDHRALASHFGLAPLIPANDAPGPLEIKGQLRHDPKGGWIAGGSARLGPTSITGRLIHQQDSPKETWEAKVSLGNPRKDSLAPFLTLAGLRSVNNWTPRSILGRLPQTAFRTAWLDTVDGSLSLVAKGGLAGDGIDLSAHLKEGFLYIDALEAALWNGDLRAEMSLERRRDQPSASLAVTLDQVDADAFTEWLGMQRTIEGPLNLELEAASVGRSVFDLVRGLSGGLNIEVGPGKLLGAQIPTFRKTLRDRSRGNLQVSPSIEDLLTMPLLDFKASGELRRGIATFDEGNLTFDPGLGIKAEASVDGTLDLLLWIAELTLNVTTDDRDLAPFPLRIVGSPSRPQGLILDQ